MIKVLDKGYVELVNHLGDDNTIVSAARVSVLGASKGLDKDALLIRYLLEHEHTSPFEQVEFQFRVKCPIFVARQWMRHRTWSYNEVSRRYTSEELDFYLPTDLRKQAENNRQASDGSLETNFVEQLINSIKVQTESAFRVYEIMLNYGVAREQARMVLPLNTYTSFYAKTDLHNLLHFLKLRNHPDAQEEIRVYAKAIELLIEPIVPITFKIWKGLIRHEGQ